MRINTVVALLLTASTTVFPAKAADGAEGQGGLRTPAPNRESPIEDHLLTDGIFEVVVGASPRPHLDFYGFPTANAQGSILDVRHRGADFGGDVMIGSPVLSSESWLRYPVYSSIEVADDGFSASAIAHGELDRPTQRFEVSTVYALRPGTGIIDVRSRLSNTGTEAIEGVRFSLHSEPKPFYVFSPYDSKHHRGLSFMCVPGSSASLAWVDFNPRDDNGEPLPLSLDPGQSHEISYALAVDRDGGRLLDTAYRLLDIEATPVLIRLQGLETRPVEVIVRNISSGAVFFRSFGNDPSPVAVTLPPGIYTVTGNFFPAVVETVLSVGSDATECTLVNPARGQVRVDVRDEHGNPTPGKVSFFGLDSTPTPYFQPHDPVTSGLAWEEVKNSIFPGLSTLTLELPVGSYLASASRGPEHTIDQHVVEVLAEQTTELHFVVERVVDTEGLVAVDTHMHTLMSDGSVTARERVLSAVAEGVEVAVATDHFFRHDLSPAVEAVGLQDFLQVIAGSEISIRNPVDYEYTLDFNLYPLAAEESGWSAVETMSEEVAPIFEATRKRYPNALIQINHPRYSSWDYLNSYQLDPDSAANARGGFWTGFDVLEVLNGPSLGSSNNSKTVRDWLNLLARGFFFPAVASSDAHDVDSEETGYSRTYVYVDDRDLKNMDIGAVIESIKKGRSFVTNGPIVELTVNDRYLPGDTLSAANGEVGVSIEVRAAPWISVTEVRVIVNRETVRVLAVESAPGSVRRLRRSIRLDGAEDAFIVVEVTGAASLYPVVQVQSKSGLRSDAVTPYALTNPVFVDFDGNGRFDPPLPRRIEAHPAGRAHEGW